LRNMPSDPHHLNGAMYFSLYSDHI
jgi:hypothetical protein